MFKLTNNMETQQPKRIHAVKRSECRHLNIIKPNEYDVNAKWNVSIARTHQLDAVMCAIQRSPTVIRTIPKPIFKRHKQSKKLLSQPRDERYSSMQHRWNFAILNVVHVHCTQIAAPQKFSIIFHYYHYDSCLNISVWLLLEVKRENISHHKSRLVCLNCWLLWNGLKELIFLFLFSFSRGFEKPPRIWYHANEWVANIITARANTCWSVLCANIYRIWCYFKCTLADCNQRSADDFSWLKLVCCCHSEIDMFGLNIECSTQAQRTNHRPSFIRRFVGWELISSGHLNNMNRNNYEH